MYNEQDNTTNAQPTEAPTAAVAAEAPTAVETPAAEPKLNKKQQRLAKRAAREAAAATATAAEPKQKGTRNAKSEKGEEKKVEKKRDKERVRRFTGVAEAKDSMYAVLLGCVEKKPEELSQIEMTALALTLIPSDSTVEWKSLIEQYNSKIIDGAMTASTRSDGTTGKNNDSPKGFNLRNQLFNAEHKEKNPLRVVRGQKYMNMKVHSNDGKLRGRLEGFTLMPSTHKMLNENQELVEKLHRRFFKRSK